MRLVTLTGTGGIGKTRLAIKVAAELLECFSDGVWLIELASLTHPEYIITAIASALKIQLQPGNDPKKQMIEYLAKKRVLLILDNFEHLLSEDQAVSLVSELLRGTLSLKCLVTSQVRLKKIYGEQIFKVPPLPVPEEDADVFILSQNESVQLFIERAKQVKHDFSLTPQNAGIISAICRRLEGIPLAIELAAVRVWEMTVQRIHLRLERQFELLVTDYLDVHDRQKTLKATIDWSYALLSPEEQQLFAQLSVFSGGFFIEAALTVCSAPDELIISLLDKSLLTVEEVMDRSRYRLLEPLREYSKEKLLQSEELKTAHATYYLGLAADLDSKLAGAEQTRALSVMMLELDNFRAAMDFAQAQGEWKRLGELAALLFDFFYIRGLWSEEIQHLSLALPGLRNLGDNTLLTKVLNQLGIFDLQQGDYPTARNLFTESLQIGKRLSDKRGIALSLNNLGNIAINQGAYNEAKALHTQSLKIRSELSDKRGIAFSLTNLGIIAINQGAYNEAKALHTQSLKIRSELSDKRGIAISLYNLGKIAINQGAYDEARQILTESLQIFRELQDQQGIAYPLNNLGIIAMHQGAYDEARRLHTQSLKIRSELSDQSGIAYSLYQFGKLAEAENDVEQAVLLLLVAARRYEEMQSTHGEYAVEVKETLAKIQREIDTRQFEQLKEQAEAISVEQVIELALGE